MALYGRHAPGKPLPLSSSYMCVAWPLVDIRLLLLLSAIPARYFSKTLCLYEKAEKGGFSRWRAVALVALRHF